jgi:hypothetical protein
MRPFSCLRTLLGRDHPRPRTGATAPRRPTPRARPCLEPLEDRCVLAARFTVTNLNDGVGVPGRTLREAIQAANATTATDTIVFKTGLEGTIRLTGGELGILQPLVLAGPGASKINLDGNAGDRIFRVDNGNNSTLIKVTIKGLTLFNGSESIGGAIASSENLTVANSVITGNRASGNGGGILEELGTLTLRRSTVSGNTSGQIGGGLYATSTAAGLVIDQSTIRANRAGLYGGGLFTNAALTTITGSKITFNTAQSHAGGLGTNSGMVIDGSTISGNLSRTGNAGGLSQFGGSLTLTNSTVSGNRANLDGGGLLVGNTTSATIRGCTIADNTALQQGGGLASSNNAMTVDRSVISGNASTDGGGIHQVDGTLRLTSSTVSGNRAQLGGGVQIDANSGPSIIRGCTIAFNSANKGGGLYGVASLAVTIQNSTISGNTASQGGGLSLFLTNSPWVIQICTIAFNRGDSEGGGIHFNFAVATLESTIVANNSAPEGRDLFSTEALDFFTLNFSLVRSTTGASVILDQTSIDLEGKDPLLAPLANNGGPTQTHALKKGSPCINRGSNPANLTTDQRGGLFKRKLGIQVDIGAYERQ